jgi:enamine deaminase RidA (YjgF/YER057c/UK114 family)
MLNRINPPGLSAPVGYAHVVEVSPGRTIYVSGQVAFNAAGQLVGEGAPARRSRFLRWLTQAC